MEVVADTSALLSLEAGGVLDIAVEKLDFIISSRIKEELTGLSQNNDFEGNLAKNFHITAINAESFNDMLSKRDEVNVVNETFNNHVILYGAEQYYGLLGERDVR